MPEGHPDRPFNELSESHQHHYLIDTMIKYVDEFTPPSRDMHPTYDKLVIGWPNFIVGFHLLESGLKYLIRSQANPKWSKPDTKIDKERGIHDLYHLYGMLDENSRKSLDNHFAYLRLSVEGWRNPRETLDEFLANQKGIWRFRYGLIEDTSEIPPYTLLEMRELVIGLICLIHPRHPAKFGVLPVRIKCYKLDEISHETEERWMSNQSGTRHSKPDLGPSTMREVDLSLWESGVQTIEVWKTMTLMAMLKHDVDQYARDISLEQHGVFFDPVNAEDWTASYLR